jgi:hypothetical protein
MEVSMKSETKRGPGRPPKSETDKISDRPKMAVYLPPMLKGKLLDAAHVLNKPAYELIEIALEAYLGSLPKADREALEILSARRSAHSKEREKLTA